MRSGRLGLSAIDKLEIWSRWKSTRRLVPPRIFLPKILYEGTPPTLATRSRSNSTPNSSTADARGARSRATCHFANTCSISISTSLSGRMELSATRLPKSFSFQSSSNFIHAWPKVRTKVPGPRRTTIRAAGDDPVRESAVEFWSTELRAPTHWERSA